MDFGCFTLMVGGVETAHIWDGANIVGDAVNGVVGTTYVRGINLVASKTGGVFTYYLYNGHGDVVQLASAGGSVTKAYDYDSFGNERSPVATDANPFRYCGEYWDRETNTVYLRARYYSPVIGRFTQEDPAKADFSYYTYANSNPILCVDPLGLDAVVMNNQGVPVAGHMSMMMQDKDGNWYFFFFGGTVRLERIPLDFVKDIDKLNKWLKDMGINDPKSPDYASFVYIEGDFTKSYDYAKKYMDDYTNSHGNMPGFRHDIAGFSNQNPYYDVGTNNCSLVTLEILSKGTLTNGTNVGAYLFGSGYGDYITSVPNLNLGLLQNAFKNDSFYKTTTQINSNWNWNAKYNPFVAVNLAQFNLTRAAAKTSVYWSSVLYYNLTKKPQWGLPIVG